MNTTASRPVSAQRMAVCTAILVMRICRDMLGSADQSRACAPTSPLLKMRHLLGPLVHQQGKDGHIRMVLNDSVRHMPHNGRFPGFRRGNDQPPMSLSVGTMYPVPSPSGPPGPASR